LVKSEWIEEKKEGGRKEKRGCAFGPRNDSLSKDKKTKENVFYFKMGGCFHKDAFILLQWNPSFFVNRLKNYVFFISSVRIF
jgi:hypothetical protein